MPPRATRCGSIRRPVWCAVFGREPEVFQLREPDEGFKKPDVHRRSNREAVPGGRRDRSMVADFRGGKEAGDVARVRGQALEDGGPERNAARDAYVTRAAHPRASKPVERERRHVHHHRAAVGNERRAGHERRVRRCEERAHGRDLVRIGRAPQRHVGADACARRRACRRAPTSAVPSPRRPSACGPSRAHRIRPHAVRPVVTCERPGEPSSACLPTV